MKMSQMRILCGLVALGLTVGSALASSDFSANCKVVEVLNSEFASVVSAGSPVDVSVVSHQASVAQIGQATYSTNNSDRVRSEGGKHANTFVVGSTDNIWEDFLVTVNADSTGLLQFRNTMWTSSVANLDCSPQ
jgi:hypothetical protein